MSDLYLLQAMIVLIVSALCLPIARAALWWDRPWLEKWVDISVDGKTYPILTRRAGNGSRQVFCVQGGPGALFWDLNFLAVHLDLQRFEIIQYNPLGSRPSPCSFPREPCAEDKSWMTVDAFVSMMDQVHSALSVADDAIIVGHSFGVVCILEFLLRWPRRAAGAVLSDWVASQVQAARRNTWCNRHGWTLCRIYNSSSEEPWREVGLTNPLLGNVFWGPHGDGVNGALQFWDVRSKLASIRHVPTLSFAGEFDIVYPSDVEEMSAELQGKYVLLPGAGHFSFADQRDRWLQAFHLWLQDVPLSTHASELWLQAVPPIKHSGGCQTGFGDELPHYLQDSSTSPVPQMLNGRRYFLSLPPSYRRGLAHSLILSFHGNKDRPQGAPFFGATPATAGSTDVVFVFPEGMDDATFGGEAASSWNGSGSVGSPGPAGPTCDTSMVSTHCADSCVSQGGCTDACWLTTCADDVSFIASLLDKLESSYCIDLTSVHAVGFSGGGWLVLELGTNPKVAHRFKSIAAFAGLPFRGFNKPPALQRGSRFVGIYGRSDTLVPGFPNCPEDPTQSIAGSGFFFSTWANTSHLWAETMGCGALQNSSWLRPSSRALECFDYKCYEGMVSVCLWDGPHEIAPGALSVAWQVFFLDTAPFASSPSRVEGKMSVDNQLACCLAGMLLMTILAICIFWHRSRRDLGVAAPLLPEETLEDSIGNAAPRSK